MTAEHIIQIGEENSPNLRELETRAAVRPCRQFACQPQPGRFYFVNFAAFRNGLDAQLEPASDHEINNAVMQIAASINGGNIGMLESPSSGNPGRELSVDTREKNRILLANVGVLTADPIGLHTPADAELHQLFSFLTRCHPLA